MKKKLVLLSIFAIACFSLTNCEQAPNVSDIQDLEESVMLKSITIPRVAFDIMPFDCPNLLNTISGGVLPVAILGSAHFDVTQIDPASIRLRGVAPLRWALEDVTGPVPDTSGECDCLDTESPDGYVDLTIKFNKQEVVAVLGEITDGDNITLIITGNFGETSHGETSSEGTSFKGRDCVIIKAR